jgi:HK97 gp10 family phage protein
VTFTDKGARTFVAGMPRAIDEGVEETAADVLDERDNLVPIDTGELLDSGTVRKVADGHYEVREGDGLKDARAHYTEWGTATQSAQPHMTPAAERNRPALARNVAARLKALEKRSRV